VIIMSVILFASGLALPAFCSTGKDWFSLEIFSEGWGWGAGGVFYILANLLIFAAWILRNSPRVSGGCAWGALLLCLSFVVQDRVPFGVGEGTIISSYGAGYWLWCLAALAAACHSFLPQGVKDGGLSH
jgi:hypothetical protein